MAKLPTKLVYFVTSLSPDGETWDGMVLKTNYTYQTGPKGFRSVPQAIEWEGAPALLSAGIGGRTAIAQLAHSAGPAGAEFYQINEPATALTDLRDSAVALYGDAWIIKADQEAVRLPALHFKAPDDFDMNAFAADMAEQFPQLHLAALFHADSEDDGWIVSQDPETAANRQALNSAFVHLKLLFG